MLKLIVVPAGPIAKGRHACFSAGQVGGLLLILISLAFALGVLLREAWLLAAAAAKPEPAVTLSPEAQRLAQARGAHELQAHLDALARRVGELQAQIARLDGLGKDLARRAKLDPRKFELRAPAATRTAVAPPDFETVLAQLAAKVEAKSMHLHALDVALADQQFLTTVTPHGWPLDGGRISSGFGRRLDPLTGRRRFHEGVDIVHRPGAPIRALAAGIVRLAEEKDGYGLLVEIDHGRGKVTRYAHGEALLVKPGDKVDNGQAIALVGNSGRSTGPHLHIEVLRDERPVDPRAYLRAGA